MLSFRRPFALCACVFSLAACGHPIRDLADGVKGLIPDDAKQSQSPSATPTTTIALIANLYADAPLAPAWDAKRPEASSSFIVSGSPYTSDGHVVDLRLYFCKVDALSWRWRAQATNAGEASSELGAGELTFSEDGALVRVDVSQTLRLPHADGSLSAPVKLSFGTPQGADADGFDGVTATQESSRLVSYEQDGGPSD
jgi:hypothetical protein